MEELLIEGEDEFFESFRSKRIQELSSSQATSSEAGSTEEFGFLTEIGHEKEVMHLSTSLPRLIIHFYSPTFRSCQILNEHLRKLAQKYAKTRFVFIEATKAPFLVVKMQVQMLPCLVSIANSIVVDRMIGFDELGGMENFTTKQLEERLAQSRIFQVFGKLKVSADRRDITEQSDYSEDD